MKKLILLLFVIISIKAFSQAPTTPYKLVGNQFYADTTLGKGDSIKLKVYLGADGSSSLTTIKQLNKSASLLQTSINSKQSIIATGSTLQYIRGDGSLATLNTDIVPQGSTNLYWSQTLFNTSFSGKNSDNLTEGTTNLFYTTARANLKADKTTTITATGNGITGGGSLASNRTLSLDFTYLDGRYQSFLGYTPFNSANIVTNLTGADNSHLPTALAVANAISAAGGGTVTSFSKVDGYGVLSTVTNPTTAITYSLKIDTSSSGLLPKSNLLPIGDARWLRNITGITAGGDLVGIYPNPTVGSINGITYTYYDPTSSIQGQLNNKQHTFSLTTSGSSGAATFGSNILNIPTYTLSGLGGQPSGNYITALTGDVTASGPNSVVATLATVNSSPGSYGSANSYTIVNVNGKGLVTSSTSGAIQIAESQVTNLVSDLSGKQPVGSYLVTTNNLSDLTSASTARTNLGLGTLATQNGTFSGTSSGTNTGDQTNITGNAGTSTAFQTARTINGVSFNGTSNVSITANTPNALTFNNLGSGASSGSTFNGNSLTVSYNTIGAASQVPLIVNADDYTDTFSGWSADSLNYGSAIYQAMQSHLGQPITIILSNKAYVPISQYTDKKLGFTGLKIIGAKTPEIASDAKSLVNGSIIQGGFPLTPYSDMTFNNFGVDAGKTVCDTYYSGRRDVDAFSVTYGLIYGKPNQNNFNSTGITTLCYDVTANVHAFVIEGITNAFIDNNVSEYGVAGFVIKTQNTQVSNVRSYGHQGYAVIIKADSNGRYAQNVQMSNIIIDTIPPNVIPYATNNKDYRLGLYLFGSQTALSGVQISNVQVSNYTNNVYFTANASCPISNVHINSIISIGGTNSLNLNGVDLTDIRIDNLECVNTTGSNIYAANTGLSFNISIGSVISDNSSTTSFRPSVFSLGNNANIVVDRVNASNVDTVYNINQSSQLHFIDDSLTAYNSLYNHNNHKPIQRIVTPLEANAKYVLKAGDTMTGNLNGIKFTATNSQISTWSADANYARWGHSSWNLSSNWGIVQNGTNGNVSIGSPFTQISGAVTTGGIDNYATNLNSSVVTLSKITKGYADSVYSAKAGSSAITTIGTLVTGSIPYSLLTGTPSIPTVSGTNGYIPQFTGASSIGNSIIQGNSLNIGINQTPRNWWTSQFKATDFPAGSIASQLNSTLYIAQNAYFDNSATNWLRNTSNRASLYIQGGGVQSFYHALYGSSGSAISFVKDLQIDSNGVDISGNLSAIYPIASGTPKVLTTDGSGVINAVSTTGANSGTFLNGVGGWTTPIGSITSVSNSDGTLTISPTTGTVVASLALGHLNLWSNIQENSTAWWGIQYNVYPSSGSFTNHPVGIFANPTTADRQQYLQDANGIIALTSQLPIHGNSTTTGTATTAVTVTIGSTLTNTTYNTTITPRDLLTAVNYYVSAQTTTTFTVTFVSALTGSINFDWNVTP